MKKQLCTLALSSLLATGMTFAQQSGSTNGGTAQDGQAGSSAGSMQNGQMDQGSMGGMHHGKHGDMMKSPDEQLAHMTKKYNLTADQQSQIKPILEDSHQQMMTMKSDPSMASMSKQDKMAKMQDQKQMCNQKIEAVLNDDQKKKFEADQMKMQQKHAMKMQNGSTNGSTTNPQQ